MGCELMQFPLVGESMVDNDAASIRDAGATLRSFAASSLRFNRLMVFLFNSIFFFKFAPGGKG